MLNELARLPADTRDLLNDAYRSENEALFAQFSSMDAHAQTSWKFQRYAKDYLRTAQGVDDSVGGILSELDRLGVSDNTIVIYTSDQGWFLGEHGWFDKRWMYEESFRMPLVVRWPGTVKAGVTSQALVQNIDFAPTFLEAAGVPIPADMQGKSMLALLRDGGVERERFRDAVYYRFEESKGPHTVPRHEGLATSKYKHVFADPIDLRHHVLLIGLGSFANSGRIRFRSVSRARPGICRSKPLSRPLLAKPPGPAVSGEGA